MSTQDIVRKLLVEDVDGASVLYKRDITALSTKAGALRSFADFMLRTQHQSGYAFLIRNALLNSDSIAEFEQHLLRSGMLRGSLARIKQMWQEKHAKVQK